MLWHHGLHRTLWVPPWSSWFAVGSAQARVQQRPPLATQVMRVGMQLLVARQVPALLPVLRLAGTVSEEPALQFLKVGAPPCL